VRCSRIGKQTWVSMTLNHICSLGTHKCTRNSRIFLRKRSKVRQILANITLDLIVQCGISVEKFFDIVKEVRLVTVVLIFMLNIEKSNRPWGLDVCHNLTISQWVHQLCRNDESLQERAPLNNLLPK